VVFGLSGAIAASGDSYDSVMPTQGRLADDEIAATVNYVLGLMSWPAHVAPTPITPNDVFQLRKLNLTADKVRSSRPAAFRDTHAPN
jgi:hypothetical protein